MADLTITHTPATGTLIDGTSRGDGVNVILRAASMAWKWSPSLGQFYVQRSRDKVVPDRYGIERTADALREAGHTVTVEIGAGTRTAEEREQDRAARTERRVDMLTDRSERRASEAEQRGRAADAISDAIPFGQPILVGHHSERRHRRAIEKIQRNTEKSAEASRAARYAAQGAEAAEAHQSYRQSLPVTLRRIETLEAEERKLQRKLDVAVIVGGADRHGHPAPRALRPGWSAVLAALPGERFDVRGPHVTACAECGELIWTDTEVVLAPLQRHYSDAHGHTPALLP